MTSLAQPRDEPAETPVRDAACLILVDRSDEQPRLLMGRRLPTQAFLPNKWVFPGGRVDDADWDFGRLAAIARSLPASDAGHLPYAYAAVRETFEEAGILITPEAATSTVAGTTLAGPPTPFTDLAMLPTLDLLKPLARAITPPGLPRRFDTWFYVLDWDRNRASSGTPDGELLDLGWFTLPEILTLDLPIITRLIVQDVATRLGTPERPEPLLIPFYFQAVEGYRRTLIDPVWPWPDALPLPLSSAP